MVEDVDKNGTISVNGVIMKYYQQCEKQHHFEHLQADAQSWLDFVQSQLFSYQSTV